MQAGTASAAIRRHGERDRRDRGPNESVAGVRCAQPQNARIDIGSSSAQASAFTYSVPDGTQDLSFIVVRVHDGPFLVPFTVIDGDGEWATFIGAGS
jgi:hypothetical protein